MRHKIVVTDEVSEILEDIFRIRLSLEHFVGDAGNTPCAFRNQSAAVNQAVEFSGYGSFPQVDRGNFYNAMSPGSNKSGGLHINSYDLAVDNHFKGFSECGECK